MNAKLWKALTAICLLRLWHRRSILVSFLLMLAVLTATYYVEGRHQQVRRSQVMNACTCAKLDALGTEWGLCEIVMCLLNPCLLEVFCWSWLPLHWVWVCCIWKMGEISCIVSSTLAYVGVLFLIYTWLSKHTSNAAALLGFSCEQVFSSGVSSGENVNLSHDRTSWISKKCSSAMGVLTN